MSNDQDPARERLLDASLSELLGRSAASSAESELSIPPSAAAIRNNGWLAAALVLLGSVVVIGSWVWSRPDEPARSQTVAGQGQGKPLPKLWPKDPNDEHPELPLTVCTDMAKLEALPGDIVNLSVELPALKDLERLARFSNLIRLHLRGSGPGTFWTMLGQDAGALDPLQKLQSLQILKLPPNFALALPHVRALKAMRSLRSLSITGSHPLTAEIAKELMAWPSLRQLELQLALVPPSFFEELQKGELHELVLAACPNVGAPEFAAIAKIKSLKSLAVMMAGMGSSSIDGQRYKSLELDQDAFDAFRALPNLVALDLDESQFDDKFMAQLPKQLRYLRLGDHVMTPSTIADLKRLQNLEELRFNHATKHEDVMDLLQSLPLKRLWLRGWLNDDVLRTLSKHQTLEDLTLRTHREDDVAAFTPGPKLRSLTLRFDSRFGVPSLPPALVGPGAGNGLRVILDGF